MNRIKIEKNKYKIGDMINGNKIVSFGKSWEGKKPSKDFCKNGVRYEEHCDLCGKIVFELDNNTSLCSSCFGGSETVEMCYAYFD